MRGSDLARGVMDRCAALATYSEEEGRLTRRYGTPALRAAQDAVADWMRTAGMEVRRDSMGNLFGRLVGDGPAPRMLLLGSHLDTVRDAGRYDGPLGILVALASLEMINARARRLPFTLEIGAFADEEGLRFHSTYLGSAVAAGTFDPSLLHRRDATGVSLREAVIAFGGDPARLSLDGLPADRLLGYCEVHIEQGPVLEAQAQPVGVVSAIAGQTRVALRLSGVAGHAGTVPMDLRRDALGGAAEIVLAVERIARARPGVVATVGELAVEPGASNVIPGLVTLSIDVRHQEDGAREAACRALREQVDGVCSRRRLEGEWRVVHETPAVACDAGLTALLEGAVRAAGYACLRLPSGAGHDAVALHAITPVAMLFVRCAGGISHSPAETVAVEDVAVAIDVLARFLDAVADGESGGAAGPSPLGRSG